MGVDDELSTPILQNSDDDDERFRRRFNDDELDAGGQSGCCCNPSSGCHRFIALILMCLVGFGEYSIFASLEYCLLACLLIIFHSNNFSASYFCYDNPGALQNYFMKDMDMSTTQFVWLYSIYSWPNVVLCFIGGFLMDRLVFNFFTLVLF